MPRTQLTICGAPKAIAIPRMAAIHHPHEMRFAIAMAPSTMTRITAMGVSHARMFDCRAVAPVMNGEDAWASAGSGELARSANRTTAPTMLSAVEDLLIIALPISCSLKLVPIAPQHECAGESVSEGM